jgi:thioredoxin-dependent peroxiredoxin
VKRPASLFRNRFPLYRCGVAHPPSMTRTIVMAALLAGSTLAAQQPASTSMKGQKAPDFTVRVANKDGVASQPFRLSEHLGETVVLAFFFQARTRG